MGEGMGFCTSFLHPPTTLNLIGLSENWAYRQPLNPLVDYQLLDEYDHNLVI